MRAGQVAEIVDLDPEFLETGRCQDFRAALEGALLLLFKASSPVPSRRGFGVDLIHPVSASRSTPQPGVEAP